MIADEPVFERMVQDCMEEENMDHMQAEDLVLDMIQATKRFLDEDYDQIMHDIKHKINIYLQIAIGRARFLRNRENDIRGNVERTMRYLMEEMTELSMKDTLPEEMEDLFQLNSHEFLDEGSVRFPRQMQSIKEPVSISSSRFSTIASDGKRVVTIPRCTPLRRILSSSISLCRMSISGETSTPFFCA